MKENEENKESKYEIKRNVNQLMKMFTICLIKHLTSNNNIEEESSISVLQTYYKTK